MAETRGPLTAVLAVPGTSIQYFPVERPRKNEQEILTVPYTEQTSEKPPVFQSFSILFIKCPLNTAPLAGQAFEITGIGYSFPEATKAKTKLGLKQPGNVKFTIRAYKGSAKIAEQTIIEYAEQETAEAARASGTMEPFYSTTLYPGENLEIEIVIQNLSPSTTLSLGTGSIYVNYNLIKR